MTMSVLFFFFNDTATTEIYTLSLHDALPISWPRIRRDHTTLSARRHALKRTSPVADAAFGSPTRTISAQRQAVGLPGEPLIMPNLNRPRAPPAPVQRDKSA